MTVTVEELFGRGGTIYPELASPIIAEGVGTPYPFMELPTFEQLPSGDKNRVYWEEMLYRAHWAAISNLIRYRRWFDATLSHSITTPNFPAFCAALRGLTEAAADTSHSLGSVPETLASCSSRIIDALNGAGESMTVSQDLEDMLIHFLFARRVSKSEAAPATHKAESASKYLTAIDHDDYPVKELYSELCQVVHPAAQSLDWLTTLDAGGWAIGEPDDARVIVDLCSRHKDSIEWIQQHSVNIPIFILQVLSAFPIPSLHTKSTHTINMQQINLYNKIRAAFDANGVQWAG